MDVKRIPRKEIERQKKQADNEIAESLEECLSDIQDLKRRLSGFEDLLITRIEKARLTLK